MMKRDMEQGLSQFEVRKALYLHEYLVKSCQEKAEGNELLLYKAGDGKLFVAPNFGRAINNPVEFAVFKGDLSFGIKPDFETDTVYIFDNVPGFVISQGQIVQDPYRGAVRGNFEALDKLAELTKQRAERLVRRTKMHVYPSIDQLRRAVWDTKRKNNPVAYAFIMPNGRNSIPGVKGLV